MRDSFICLSDSYMLLKTHSYVLLNYDDPYEAHKVTYLYV